MRGAFGFSTRVPVAATATEVLAEPNNEVGEGPSVGGRFSRVGVTVGVASCPGVREGNNVAVLVAVGCAVGTTGSDAASHPAMRSTQNRSNAINHAMVLDDFMLR